MPCNDTALHQEDLEPSRFTCNASNLIEPSVATDATISGTGSTANPLSVPGIPLPLTEEAIFFDEIWGILSGQWATRVTTGARNPINRDNGWFEFVTGAVATNEESIDWNDVLQFTNTKQPNMAVYLQLPSIADVEVDIGLIEASGGADDDYIKFFYDASAGGTWNLEVSNAGAVTTSVGAAATTNEVELSWRFLSDTSIEWFIDGVSQGTVATNVPIVQLQPFIAVRTETTAAKTLNVDYVRITQDRV